MKKSTQLITYFQQWLSKFLPNEKPNLKENEEKIMYLLKWGNGSKLSIQETIELFQSIEGRINNDVAKYKDHAISDLAVINKFDGSILKTFSIDAVSPTDESLHYRIKEHLKDPVFDKPLSEIEVDYKEITFDKKQI